MATGRQNSIPEVELVAPAGDWDCLRAAVANGADAVYFGLRQWNARMRAENFGVEELPAVMRFLRERGVRGYLALNVLLFEEELEDAAELLRAARRAGVDAVILQDVGLADAAALLAPGLRVHASTQMTLTSPQGLAFAQRLGVRRAVLARETSLREMEKFAPLVETEVFVHGALCVAYSGQCLTSEALGQRSANRGECAQACRLPYGLLVDGHLHELGSRRYLLSPQDLAAAEEVPALLRLGVQAFKIEGRLKSPEYVAAVTAVYRKVIDRCLAEMKHTGKLPAKAALGADERYRLEMAFSRGLYTGWLYGVNHQELVHAQFGKKRGPLAGRVLRVGRGFVELESDFLCPLRPGDGIVFESGGDPENEPGGRIYGIEGRVLHLRSGLDLRKVRPGDRVWKTDDPILNEELRRTWQGRCNGIASKKLAVDFVWSGKVGSPLVLSARVLLPNLLADNEGKPVELTAEAQSSTPLQEPKTCSLTREAVSEAIGKLEESPFRVGQILWNVDGCVFLPIGELKRMRRAVVDKLIQKWAAATLPTPAQGITVQEVRQRRWQELSARGFVPPNNPKIELLVLCRSIEQASAAFELVDAIYLDFEDLRRYADAVAVLRKQGAKQIFLATPRVLKAGEEGFLRLIERAHPDGVLVRNSGAIGHFLKLGIEEIGDTSLNAANSLSALVYLREGLRRVSLACDLTAEQALPMIRQLPAGTLEVLIHFHVPMFHMEHCVFAAFLSHGKDWRDCGRPCERHRVRLRDRVGMEHPVLADAGCRNTVFQSQAQTGAAFYEDFVEAGIRHFRIELLEEDAPQTRRIVASYRALLDGKTDGSTLWRELRARNGLGLTTGTLVKK